MTTMNNQLEEINKSLRNKSTPNYEGFKHIKNELINSVQKSRSRRVFMDIDFDVKTDEIINDFRSKFSTSNNMFILATSEEKTDKLDLKTAFSLENKTYKEVSNLDKLLKSYEDRI
jgi:5S rRNA maturation endonuclease (ribonuclease M5)